MSRFGAGRALTAAVVSGAIGLGASATPPPTSSAGEGLAAIGGCQGCHTADDDVPFAGGRAFETPFGTIYSTNITPDPNHGIGGWAEADFERAMTRGIGPSGKRYYPVFPYPHYAMASREDVAAIWAYLRTIPPAPSQAPPNHLHPPFNARPLLAGWQTLYLHPKPPDEHGLDAEARRGAELARGLGHCGACHTPHNGVGAEDAASPLAGEMVEGWYAPPLQADSPAPAPWTVQDLETYLRTGLSDHHQAAAGPMAAVTAEFAEAPEAEVRDMAIYLSGLMSRAKRPTPVDQESVAAKEHPEGARLYAGACASCHEAGSAMSRQGRPSLSLGTPLHEGRPTDVIMIILQGLKPPEGKAGPYMPSFAHSLTDEEVAQLTAYLRARFSREPVWNDVPGAVRTARKGAG